MDSLSLSTSIASLPTPISRDDFTTGQTQTDASSVRTPSDLGASRIGGGSGSGKSAEERRKGWRIGTVCTTSTHSDQFGSSSVPVYQTATFKGLNGQYDYTRSGNPTRTALETQMARLYNCHKTYAVSTGMTALDVTLRLVTPQQVIIAGDDIYGGTDRLLTFTKGNGGAEVVHLDLSDWGRARLAKDGQELDEREGKEGALKKVLKENGTKIGMVLIESPTNPQLRIADIKAISDAVHAASPDALVVVDNTMMSPYLARPLDCGADIIYDSGTKYLGGHHDVMAGIIAVDREDLAKRIYFLINSTGTGLAPMDCSILLRGLKTLSVRMDRQCATAQIVASYLQTLGFHVNFPGLASHPRRDLHYSQAIGAGAVLSFVTGSVASSERIVGGTRLWGISVSFGCVNSLISMPCVMSHASISAAKRAERGLPEDLIRLCVGIEDARDLLDDLEHSLLEAGAIYTRFDDSAPPTPTSMTSTQTLYASDPVTWAIERAQRFARVPQASLSNSDPAADLAEGVANKLGDLGGGSAAGPDPEVMGEGTDDHIIVSAPGKVIMFGEHAVVHGATAVAAAIDLRCFAILSRRADGYLGLDLPDTGLQREWKLSDLPWSAFAGSSRRPEKDLDIQALAAVDDALKVDGLSHNAHVSALAVVYMYMSMIGNGDSRPGFTFTARSALPIGAGLGSSACYSSCISASLQRLVGTIPHHAGPSLSTQETDLIDAWAFVSEKVIHGNPSGIDNAVSVRGGCLTYARAINGKPGGMTSLQPTHTVRFLLTDTKIPRDTKVLVAGVGQKLRAEPDRIGSAIDEIESISQQATRILTDMTLARTSVVDRLRTLVDRNHELLIDLGVSHPALETIRTKTSAEPYHLSTKLTGAGGGGCAITLIPDAFPEDLLQDLVNDLERVGFRTYATAIGGTGLGILSSSRGGTDTLARGAGETDHIPLRKAFRDTSADQLAAWAKGAGKWIYT